MRLKQITLKRHFFAAVRVGRDRERNAGGSRGGDSTYALLAAVYKVCEAAFEGGRQRSLQRLCGAEPEPLVDFDCLLRQVLVACGIEDRRTRYKLVAVARWAYEDDISASDLEHRVRAAGGLNVCAAQRANRQGADVKANSWL